jgi:RHS repeat-associated protein
MTRLLMSRGIAAVAITFGAWTSAHAQTTVAVGVYPLGSYSGSPFDTINNGNLNAHFSIPVLSKAGPTLPFQYALAYDSSIWYPSYVNGVLTWTPVNATDWGWTAVGEGAGAGGYVSYVAWQESCLVYAGQYGNYYFYWTDFNDYVYHDSSGASHPFKVWLTTWHTGAPCGNDTNPSSVTGIPATDNSGFSLTANINQSNYITGQQGIKFNVPFVIGTPSSSAASVVTPNGNTISSSVAGQTTTYTDALGMTVLSATSTGSPITQETYTYSSVGNIAAEVVVKYAQATVRTNFGCTSPSTVHEFGPTSENLVSEIDMPDIATNPSDKYTFTYEQTPGYSTDTTGRITKITLPTGGTIQYDYTTGSNDGIECADGSANTLVRTLSPGGAWTYTRSNVSGTEWQTLLQDPNSNETTMKFQVATSGATAVAYETERDLPGSLGTILTCYNNLPSPCTNSSDTTAISFPIVDRTVMSTLGAETSEVNTQYDVMGYGLPTDIKEYDWGTSGSAGSLLRETATTYDYNTSCGIATGSSIVNRACGVTIKNGSGAAVTQTTNTYDANGNLLSTVSGLSPTQLTKGFTYNSNGTINTKTDVNSQIATFAYNGTGGCSDAYPTSVTGPAPSSLVVSMQWDCYGGVTTSVTDPNSKSTTFGYDNMNRVTSTSYPDGGSLTVAYSPTQVQKTTKITSNISRTEITDFDGMGRISSQAAAGAETDYTFDSLGRSYTISVKNSGQQDTYSYDAISRVVKVTHADTTYNQVGYTNNCATFTDESNKVHEVCSDGVGRTSQVIEDPSGLNYTTTYLYDPLNDLLGVVQGTQQTCQINSTWYSRCFQYDALSRMTQAMTPEAGTVNYTFDSDSTCGTSKGDLVKRVDARGIRTCNTYDSIHRLASSTYSDSTPSVTYYYDQSSYNGLTIINGLGRQTGMSDGSGETAWSFDSTGRVTTQKETISGITKSIGYSYNYDGSTATITYPSGRVITYGVDSEGRPATAEDTANGVNYVTGTCSGGACYAPQNALSSMVNGKTGSFTGISYSLAYNNRLTPSSISASSTNGTALSLAYGYFPNGNVETITNNRDTGRTATYGYDSLNRINSASSQATSGADCWGQSVPTGGYDRYGNLLTINSSKCTTQSLSLGVNGKNQITNTGYGFDASGNETGDGTYTYAWDAEGRMKSGAGVTYTFDGAGQRVADSSPKLYWHGLNGSVLAETDTSGNTSNEYVFFGGMRVARRDSSGNVYYYFGNALGSSAITTATGSICYDADFYPFGWELAITNTCGQNYKFAAMERDSGSGLDRTLFRQHSSYNGRWLSPDPSGTGAVALADPRTLNMYAYVMNNPTNLIDRSGLDPCNFGGAELPPGFDINCDMYYYSAQYSGVPATSWGCITSYCPGQYGGASWNEGGTGNNEWGQAYSSYADSQLIQFYANSPTADNPASPGDPFLTDPEGKVFRMLELASDDSTHGFSAFLFSLNGSQLEFSASQTTSACSTLYSQVMSAWEKSLLAWLKAHPGQQPPPGMTNPPVAPTCGF